ncbi:AAA family ATPase [Acidiphilium sp. PA]|uniref:AAA family ATPase n=1 Tax=Acidiphilium sp. PA TaxID=2871705 RepID=UPI002242F34C|nr:adenylate/guanylate cyclase domain-containing protein [Acidiphilium sp. PA]MCW8305887.1 AAA family ATPase [Acidiphilium sp. PA]
MQGDDITIWLEGLGLGAFASIFREQGIDGDILADLTEADLVALGLPMGPRKKLLRAIKALHGGPQPPSDAAERRNLTLLFCDMVGSTTLATRLDPEELRVILQRYMDACTAVIDQLGGYIASYHGDGLMAFFGYPEAREDAAERAVRAGLRLVQAVGQVPGLPGFPIQARIGIATGLAVVSNAADRQNGVVGQLPALAARLQSAAPPGGIVISQATGDLLGGLFTLEPLGALELKGFDQPQPAWRVIGAAASDSRFAASHRSRRAPMIGRTTELATLLDRWNRAAAADGQVVLLLGEPGFGKSRIIAALREALADAPHELEPHDLIILQCASYSQSSPLRPVIDWVERRAGFTAEETDASRQARLDEFLCLSGVARAVIEDLLGLADGADAIADQTARRERTLAALVDLLVSGVTRPRLLIFEDVHWSDTLTLELLARIVARVPGLQVLVLVSARPELALPWAAVGNPAVTTVQLDRLEPSAAAAIIERLGAGTLASDIRERIAERAGGVPLFVEELTRSVLEGDTATMTVPATLQDTLMARLDRLGPAKAIAQTGAVLGRRFPYNWLAACAGVADTRLIGGLNELIRSGLITGRGAPPDAVFSFRHALIQDAAYHSILRTERMRLHGNIASVLEQKFPRIAEDQPELVAHHYTEASAVEPALRWWQRATIRATARAAWVEAMQHLRAALRLLLTLPPGRERDDREIVLRKTMMTPLVSIGGYTTEEARKNIERLSQLLEHAPPGLDGVVLLYSESARLLMRSELDHAERLARRTLQIAQRTDIPNLPFLPQRIIGYSALLRGHLAQADYWFTTSAQGYDPTVNRDIRPGSPHDPYASMMAQDVLLLIQQGRLDAAKARGEAAVAEAATLQSPTTEAYVLSHLAIACLLLDDAAAAGAVAAALNVAVERAVWLKPHADYLNGWLAAKSGDLSGAIAQMEVGAALAAKIQSNVWSPFYRLTEAAMMVEHGKTDVALVKLDQCNVLIASSGQAYALAEVHHLRGRILRARGDAGAKAELDTALRIARQQTARFYELRAAVSLAADAEPDKIKSLLLPALAAFTPGSDHADLRRARALLEQATAQKLD